MVRSEEGMSLKNSVTQPGIDPGTVRLVAQRLNHYATPGPSTTTNNNNKLLLIFVWVIYNYIPDTKHIPRICNIAAELLLQYIPHMMLFPMKNVLYLHTSTFPSTCTVPSMVVSCSSLSHHTVDTVSICYLFLF
jgi:hypothetical protein